VCPQLDFADAAQVVSALFSWRYRQDSNLRPSD
jgi:hypothetical protein